MATVKVILGKPVAPPPATYVLELTEDEAMILRAALGCGYQTLTTPIYDALATATDDVEQHYYASTESGFLRVQRGR